MDQGGLKKYLQELADVWRCHLISRAEPRRMDAWKNSKLILKPQGLVPRVGASQWKQWCHTQESPWRQRRKLSLDSSWSFQQTGFWGLLINPWTQWPVAKWSWENNNQLESATCVPSVNKSQSTVLDWSWEDLRTRQNTWEVGIDPTSTCKTYPSCTRSGRSLS